MRVEDDDRDLAVAQHAELVGLLHQTELPLREGHLESTLLNYFLHQIPIRQNRLEHLYLESLIGVVCGFGWKPAIDGSA